MSLFVMPTIGTFNSTFEKTKSKYQYYYNYNIAQRLTMILY